MVVPGPVGGERTVVHGGLVLDGTGSLPERADVVIADGRIAEVGTDLDGDAGIDATGRTVLPGLFDCHVHVAMSGVDLVRRTSRPFSYEFYETADNLRRTLHAGITSARDAAGADAGVRRALENGLLEGPRLQVSITALSQTGGHGDGWHPSGVDVPFLLPHPGRPDGVVDGPDEMRRRVREILRAGADVIKVCTTGGVASPGDDPRHSHFRSDELDVMMAEVRGAGSAAMAHAHGADGIKNAVRAGVRSIEHGIYLDDEAIEMMLRAGTWLVPTLSAPHVVLELAASGASLPESVLAKAREVTEAHAESFRRAHEAGVRIAMGTDSGVGPHGRNLSELAHMARAMPALEALAAATSSSAALLRVDDRLGRVAPGLLADLVVVDGEIGEADDLADLSSRLRTVVQGGRVITRNTD